jgi:hypothetical protein
MNDCEVLLMVDEVVIFRDFGEEPVEDAEESKQTYELDAQSGDEDIGSVVHLAPEVLSIVIPLRAQMWCITNLEFGYSVCREGAPDCLECQSKNVESQEEKPYIGWLRHRADVSAVYT